MVNPVSFTYGVCLFKSGSIAAAATQLLRRISGCKAIINCFGLLRVQNLVQVLSKDVAQWNISLMVKTAWDNSAVTKDSYVIPHAIAKYPVTLHRCGQVRPVEFIAML